MDSLEQFKIAALVSVVGSYANASVTVNMPGSDGDLKIEVWKDISMASDEGVKICPYSVTGYYGDRQFSCSFTAAELTTGSFRHYYFKGFCCKPLGSRIKSVEDSRKPGAFL